MKIMFSASRTIGGKLIRLGTISRWNHVDLIFEDGVMIGSTTRLGVEVTNLQDRIKNNHVCRYKIDKIKTTETEDAIIRRFVEGQIGKPYDYTGILAFLNPLREPLQDDTKWFCSELVAAAFSYAGVDLVRLDASWVTPGMIDRSPLLSPVLAEQRV